MAEVKWIKIVTDIFDNRKIKQIEIMPDGDTILVIWFKLICLAGSINDNGLIYLTPEIPYTEEMLAAQFGRSLPIVRLALRTFESFGMIEVVDNFLCLPSWEKYQSAERLAHMRSKNAERQARFRERKRAELAEKTVTPALPVTPSNALDIDNRDRDKRLEKENKDLLPEAETASNQNPPENPPPLITLSLNDGSQYPIYKHDVDTWQDLYPAVNVMQALRSMKGWLDSNPRNRKTKNGIKRFVNSWLSREQDKYHPPTRKDVNHGSTENDLAENQWVGTVL